MPLEKGETEDSGGGGLDDGENYVKREVQSE